jgi:hypothetical protein
MMWILPKPDVAEAEAELIRGLTYANGTPVYPLTPAERARVMAVYVAYEDLAGQPASQLLPNDLADACLGAIHDAYAEVQKTRRLSDLRDRLTLPVEHCPLCGFGEIAQLDHFLPKSIYRALSIYARNLVPTSGPCNNAKLTYVADADAPKLLHPYFAEIPDVSFFKADVTFDHGALTVSFLIGEDGISPELATSLNFQLGRLKLNERYPKQINQFLFGQRTGILEAAAGGDPTRVLIPYLVRSAEGLRKDFGRNDWRPALMAGLAECEAFCAGGVQDYFTKPHPHGA